MDRHTIMYTNASLSIRYNLSNVSLSLVEKENEKDLKRELDEIKQQVRELHVLIDKQKMTESTSNDDSDTSKESQGNISLYLCDNYNYSYVYSL